MAQTAVEHVCFARNWLGGISLFVGSYLLKHWTGCSYQLQNQSPSTADSGHQTEGITLQPQMAPAWMEHSRNYWPSALSVKFTHAWSGSRRFST